MKVALAHDMLAARAGGERVLVALARIWPDAEIHTLIHDPDATFGELHGRTVHSSRLSRVAWIRRNYRSLALLGPLLWRLRRIDADVVICSTSGLSHHFGGRARRVVYCHTPARWLHATDAYLTGWPLPVRMIARATRPLMRRSDRYAMRRADAVIANSHRIAEEIHSRYGIEAEVIAPPSSLELDGSVTAVDGLEPGFALSVTRPLGYKRLDVLVDAARRRPDDCFVLIGDGPHRDALRAEAPDNLKMLGAVGDDVLRWCYRNARAAVVTAAEDFGLVPLEATAHGLTTIAPNARGLRDHDPDTLELYEFGSVDGLLDALDRAAPPTGVQVPARLGHDRFETGLRAIVDAPTLDT
ncbi:MAG: glycosyltransferase [Actinomycetota bacterium]